MLDFALNNTDDCTVVAFVADDDDVDAALFVVVEPDDFAITATALTDGGLTITIGFFFVVVGDCCCSFVSSSSSSSSSSSNSSFETLNSAERGVSVGEERRDDVQAAGTAAPGERDAFADFANRSSNSCISTAAMSRRPR